MAETAVSPQAIGAERVTHWWMPEDYSDYSGGYQRPSPIIITIPTGSTPWSSTGKDGVGFAAAADRLFWRDRQINGAWVRVFHMQGSTVFQPLVSLCTARPGAQFSRALHRYVWESVLHWDAAPGAGVDSGLGYYPVDHARVLAGSLQNDGILLGNVAGVLKLVTRGAGGYEEVDLTPFANPLAEWNRLAIVLRNATRDADASVTAVVNGVPAVTRTWAAGHKLPEMPAARGAWYPCMVHAEAATYLKAMNTHFYAGPGVERIA